MRLPKGFTGSLKKVSEEFLLGVWNGMGSGPRKRIIKNPPKPRPTSSVRRRRG